MFRSEKDGRDESMQVSFRVLREAVRIIFVLKISSGVASGFARVRKNSDALGDLLAVLFAWRKCRKAERFGGGLGAVQPGTALF